jgi:hypothetical protein
VSEIVGKCGDCGSPLMDDEGHDIFDTAVHLCGSDQWIWFEYDPVASDHGQGLCPGLPFRTL